MKNLGLFLALSLILISSTIVTVYADPIRTSDNQKKRTILDTLSSVTKNHYCDIGKVWIQLKNTTGVLSVYNSSSYCGTSQTPPPVEICGNGIDDDKDGQIDEGCQVPVGAIPKVDPTKTFRLFSVADVDDNSGFTTQLNLGKKYGSQQYIMAGDFQYTSDTGVFNRITSAGLKDKTIIADGNHDDCADIKTYLAVNACNYVKTFSDGKIDVLVLDGNEPFSCSNSQLAWITDKLESADAWYKIVVIHEPFVTVKSDHGPNGAFSCYDPVFQANGVDLVLQGHNHNYQVVKLGKVFYNVAGMGTHDTGSNMYGCDSSSFNSVTVKCITGTNGISVIDLPIDVQGTIKGYFVSNSDKLVHTFGGN